MHLWLIPTLLRDCVRTCDVRHLLRSVHEEDGCGGEDVVRKANAVVVKGAQVQNLKNTKHLINNRTFRCSSFEVNLKPYPGDPDERALCVERQSEVSVIITSLTTLVVDQLQKDVEPRVGCDWTELPLQFLMTENTEEFRISADQHSTVRVEHTDLKHHDLQLENVFLRARSVSDVSELLQLWWIDLLELRRNEETGRPDELQL